MLQNFIKKNIAEHLKYFAIVIVIILTSNLSYANDKKQEAVEKIKKAIVTIDSSVSMAAYLSNGRWSGTGFVVNKEKGLIVTNRHVVGGAAIGNYLVTFYNGNVLEAKVVYYDLYADFAIIKIDPQELPKDVESIKFTNKVPQLGDQVFIVGNNEGTGFSYHQGHLSDVHAIEGELPQSSYILSLNSAGGSSGSPLLNKEHQAIGIVYGRGQTYALALKSSYISHVLQSIEQGQDIKRKHIGVITTLYSLDKAARHREFPKDRIAKYIKDNPDARNRVVRVSSTLNGSTSSNLLKAGDILWSANGKNIAADLSILDTEMDHSEKEIVLGVVRDGKDIEVRIPVYNLEDHKISKVLEFAGGLFFEIDDICSYYSGAAIGSVGLVNVENGSSMSAIPQAYIQDSKVIYRLVVSAVNKQPIKNLNDLINILPQLLEKKNIIIEYDNFQPYYPSYNAGKGLVSNQEKLSEDIILNDSDTKPRLLIKAPNILGWENKDL